MGQTREGQPLKDGGACLLKDGEVLVAVAEERITRVKHAGGFKEALNYCLSSGGFGLGDLDMVVVSSCAEEPLLDGCDVGLPISRDRVRVIPSHHLSHAYASFMASPFDEAVIMIVDNEGTLIGPRESSIYWENRVERNSYYVANRSGIKLLETADDELAKEEIGPGEVYRHFTYYLGWPSYVYAGNTMGLAPFGRREAYQNLKIFELRDGQIHSLLANGRKDPVDAVRQLARSAGLHIGPPRGSHEALTPRHCDIAAIVQSELERALVYKACSLHSLTGIKNLCVGGGIALNCVANRRLLEDTPFEALYVSSVPGDSGQCLGNAYFGWTQLGGRRLQVKSITPYLGREYHESEVEEAITDCGSALSYSRSMDVASESAQLVADGNVIGWFQGKSEMGPRALGARSILADPRVSSMVDYLNLVVKHRDAFRPFAPSVLQGELSNYFDLPQDTPYMEMTGSVLQGMRNRIPAVTHIDGSSRPQTVGGGQNERFERLIRAFQQLTSVPLVLNTSFNLDGEPIVESPKDALSCFLRSELDVVVIGNFIVRRNVSSVVPRFLLWNEAR